MIRAIFKMETHKKRHLMRIPVNQPYSTTQSIPFGSPDSAARFGKHAGIDYAVKVGSNVYASVSGVVTSYIYGQFHGNVVEIHGDDGKFYHMLHNSELLVKPGQRVSEGELVSKSGATGEGVTGPHVHFGVANKSLPNVTGFSDFFDPNVLIKQGEGMASTDRAYGAVSRIYRGMTDIDPTPGQGDSWANQILAAKTIDEALSIVINISAGLGADDYKGDPNFRYKGRHYDEDMTTAKKQAYDEGLSASGSNIKPYDGPQLFTKA